MFTVKPRQKLHHYHTDPMKSHDLPPNTDVLNSLQTAIQNTNTFNNYKARFATMLKKEGFERSSIAAIAADPDKYWTHLQAAYSASVSSRRSMVTAILAIFKYVPGFKTAHNTAYVQWKKHFDALQTLQDDLLKDNRLSHRQKQAYVSYDEIRALFLRMKKESDPHATKTTSLHYVLLAILLDLPPTRADLGSLLVTTKELHRADINYIVLLPPKLPSERKGKSGTQKLNSYIVLNVYKTAKTYHRNDLELSPRTTLVIRDSLRRWPRNYLFTNAKNEPFDNHAYAHFVQRSFHKMFGRNTGMSLLRHIFVSEQADLATMSDRDKEELAGKMMHSTREQMTTYRYIDDMKARQQCDCSCECKDVITKDR